MHRSLNRVAMISAVVGSLAVGGCASIDSVHRAQDTADHALAQANSATSAAQSAQSAADRAGQKADQNAADIRAVSARVDDLVAKEAAWHHRRHHHHHRHHHRHHEMPAKKS